MVPVTTVTVVGLLGLLAVAAANETACPSGFTNINDGCYKFVEQKMKYHWAQAYCKHINAHLLVLETAREEAAVEAHAFRFHPGLHYWRIGLTQDKGKLIWHQACGKSRVLSCKDYGYGKKRTLGKKYPTVLLERYKNKWSWAGNWWDSFFPFICELKKDVKVCKGAKVGDSCFEFVDERKTWSEAREVCRSKGEYLAEVKTPAEARQIEFFRPKPGFGLWLGGRKFNGLWKWDNSGTDVNMRSSDGFQQWRTDEPNGRQGEECLGHWKLLKGGHWIDDYCHYRRPFVCQFKIDCQ